MGGYVKRRSGAGAQKVRSEVHHAAYKEWNAFLGQFKVVGSGRRFIRVKIVLEDLGKLVSKIPCEL